MYKDVLLVNRQLVISQFLSWISLISIFITIVAISPDVKEKLSITTIMSQIVITLVRNLINVYIDASPFIFGSIATMQMKCFEIWCKFAAYTSLRNLHHLVASKYISNLNYMYTYMYTYMYAYCILTCILTAYLHVYPLYAYMYTHYY